MLILIVYFPILEIQGGPADHGNPLFPLIPDAPGVQIVYIDKHVLMNNIYEGSRTLLC